MNPKLFVAMLDAALGNDGDLFFEAVDACEQGCLASFLDWLDESGAAASERHEEMPWEAAQEAWNEAAADAVAELRIS